MTEIPLLTPLFSEDVDQGDPFILAVPAEAGAAHRFYVYTTGNDPTSGQAFPVYASDDLGTWTRLPNALQIGAQGAHWAPSVNYVPGLDLPFVMLYSRAIGYGEQGHIGHTIRRAHSRTPEGPFVDSGHVLTPDLDFAIDPDVYRLPDGTLWMAYARDFDRDEPYGTGIVEAPINDDLTALTGPERILARPSHPWHVYESARVMPWKTIPGVDWSRDTVRWHTVEAAVGGLIGPDGRPVYLYSGGCFWGYYAVGALVPDDAGTLVDVTDGERGFVIQPRSAGGLYAPGHCSYLRLSSGEEYLMLHARFGSPSATRQMCLARLTWEANGWPVAAWTP